MVKTSSPKPNGRNRKEKSSRPKMQSTAVAPPGGCMVSVINIKITAKLKPNVTEYQLLPNSR